VKVNVLTKENIQAYAAHVYHVCMTMLVCAYVGVYSGSVYGGI